MKTVEVKTGRPYSVLIGEGLLASAGELIASVVKPSKALIVTDDVVLPLYGGTVAESLEKVGFNVEFFVIENGEGSKTLGSFSAIIDYLAESKFTRTDIIVALGGGVVGDLAGFVSATYLRGVKFVQIPTTLLAQIDSSVGGKTAVDIQAGKNLVGAFWQPSLVIADTLTLQTLPQKEIENGLGELLKYACLIGGEAYELISKGFMENLERVIELSVCYKRDIVEADERDQGVRALLNLGHTLAHGVELLSGYTYTHGKAVAVGLYHVAKASYKRGTLSKEDYEDIEKTYSFYDLDVTLPYSIKELAEVAKVDKKAEGSSINLVVIEGIGNCKVQKMPLDILEEYFL